MKEGQLTRVWLENIIKDGGSVLEIGAGAMDTGLFLSKNGIKYTAIEHSGYPQELCKFRAKKYGCDITVLNEKDELPQSDHCLCLSVIDHLYNPIEFVERLAQKINKCIWARPNISIDYDRPAHDKRILKDVPQAFQIIDEFNKKNGWSYGR
jgi:2-polyprenyl-3-methyl-5-hydroxy-6-metoxy-1,4-benzoquinol methylase